MRPKLSKRKILTYTSLPYSAFAFLNPCPHHTAGSDLTYLLSYLLTLWSRVLHEKPTGSQSRYFPHYYRVYKCSPPVSLLSQISPVHLNIILPSTPVSSKSSVFPTKTLYKPLPHTCFMPRPTHCSRYDHLNSIW